MPLRTSLAVPPLFIAETGCNILTFHRLESPNYAHITHSDATSILKIGSHTTVQPSMQTTNCRKSIVETQNCTHTPPCRESHRHCPCHHLTHMSPTAATPVAFTVGYRPSCQALSSLSTTIWRSDCDPPGLSRSYRRSRQALSASSFDTWDSNDGDPQGLHHRLPTKSSGIILLVI